MVQAENTTGNRPGFWAPLYHPLMTNDLKPHLLWEEMRQVYLSKGQDCEHCQTALLPHEADTLEENSHSDEEEESPSDEEDERSDDEEDEEEESPSDEEDECSDDEKDDNSEMLHRGRGCLEDLVDEYQRMFQFTTGG